MNALHRALRSLLRSPAFAFTALLTIALGIGANTAVYTVVHSVLLDPLPFAQPKSLVQVWETHPDLHNIQVSVPDYVDWKNSVHGLSLAAYTFEAINEVTLLGHGDPLEVHATNASSNLFEVLGVRPLLGNAFVHQQEQSKEPVALISEGLWRRKFSADPRIVGRAIRLENTSFIVIGVLPQTQAFPAWADVWVPFWLIEPELQTTRKYHPLEVIGRLKQGVTAQQAETEMDGIAGRLSTAYPETNGKIGAFVLPLMGQITGAVRPLLLVVWIAVGLVLLIACANLAHLAMARSFGRRRDVAVRLALGASKVVAVQEFFLETLILSLGGGVLGMAIGVGILPTLQRLAQGRIPRFDHSAFDSSAFFFGLLVSFVVALLFAAPACWQVVHAQLNETMRSGDNRGSSVRTPWSGRILLSSEVALTLGVMLAATMLVRSFVAILETDPGFYSDHVLEVNAPLSAEWDKSYEEFQNLVAPELKRLPGVEEVAAVNAAPMSLGPTERSRFATRFGITGRTFNVGQFPTAQIRWCSARYFQTLGIPLKGGRLLGDADRNQARYVVNETFAREFFPHGNAVGQKLILNVVSPHPQTVEIVGVVGNVRDFGLDIPPEPTMYLLDLSPRMDVLVKTSGNSPPVARAVSESLRRINPNAAIGQVQTLTDSVAASLARPRFALILMGGFAGLSIVLCGIGIFGVFGYAVACRLREFGIRSALGAQRQDIMALILRECLVVVLPGLLAGATISLACSRFLQILLYKITPVDPLSYIIAVASVMCLCMASVIIPARHAAKVDPIKILREQ